MCLDHRVYVTNVPLGTSHLDDAWIGEPPLNLVIISYTLPVMSTLKGMLQLITTGL